MRFAETSHGGAGAPPSVHSGAPDAASPPTKPGAFPALYHLEQPKHQSRQLRQDTVAIPETWRPNTTPKASVPPLAALQRPPQAQEETNPHPPISLRPERIAARCYFPRAPKSGSNVAAPQNGR